MLCVITSLSPPSIFETLWDALEGVRMGKPSESPVLMLLSPRMSCPASGEGVNPGTGEDKDDDGEALGGPGRAHHANELHLQAPSQHNAFPLQVTFPHLVLGTHAT